MKKNKITFQFISEPTDINFGGKVHGGTVMKWIDQAAYACARNWSESYCVTVYVGGIRFYKPINIGHLVKVNASVIYTGNSSIHIGVDVCSQDFGEEFEKKTHCVIIFVAVDKDGKTQTVKKWIPETQYEKNLAQYAIKLKQLRHDIDEEMKPLLEQQESI